MKNHAYTKTALLVKAVLASSIFCAVPMVGHAALAPINVNTNATTPNNGYDIQANNVTLTVPNGINIGQTTGVSVDNNNMHPGTPFLNANLTIAGTSTISGIVGSSNPLNAITINNGANGTFSSNVNANTFWVNGGSLGLGNSTSPVQINANIDSNVSNSALVTINGTTNINGLVGMTNIINTLSVNGPAGTTLTFNQTNGLIVNETQMQVFPLNTLFIPGNQDFNAEVLIEYNGTLSLAPGAQLHLTQNRGQLIFEINGGSNPILQLDMAGNINETGIVIAENASFVGGVQGGQINIVRPGVAPNGFSEFPIIEGGTGSQIDEIPVFANSLLSTFTTRKVGNTLDLVVTTAPFIDFVEQKNTYGIAQALNVILNNATGTGELLAIQEQLGQFISSAAFNQSLEDLAPNVNGDVLETLSWMQTLLDNVIYERIIHRDSLKSLKGINSGDHPEARYGTWAKLLGQHSRQRDRSDIDGYKADVWGIAVGADIEVDPDTLVGLALSWTHLDLHTFHSGSENDVNSYQATLYGDYDIPGPLYFNWLAAYAHNDYDLTHNIQFGNLFFAPTADFDGWQFGAKAEVGYDNVYGNAIHFIPLLSLYYAHLDLDGYTETGAGTADQIVHASRFDLLQGSAGVRFAFDCPLEEDHFQPEIHFRVFYDFINDRVEATSQFTDTGPLFETTGLRPHRTSYNIGASLARFTTNTPWVFSASYDYNFKDTYHANAGFLRARYEW
jgi:outer membrane autotransporter protein